MQANQESAGKDLNDAVKALRSTMLQSIKETVIMYLTANSPSIPFVVVE